MPDQAWLEAFKAEHGWYPWEDPNLAAKGFSPEDAYAEHLVARSLSEKKNFPGWEESWQRRYGMTDQEKPYLRPANIPGGIPNPPTPQSVMRGTPPNPAPELSPEQMASPEYGAQEELAALAPFMPPDMTGDTGPGYVPGMQEGRGVSAPSPQMPAELLETDPYAQVPSRSVMESATTETPAWAGGSDVMQSFLSMPQEIQSEVISALQNRRPLSDVSKEAVILMAQRSGVSEREYIYALADAMGVPR